MAIAPRSNAVRADRLARKIEGSIFVSLSAAHSVSLKLRKENNLAIGGWVDRRTDGMNSFRGVYTCKTMFSQVQSTDRTWGN